MRAPVAQVTWLKMNSDSMADQNTIAEAHVKDQRLNVCQLSVCYALKISATLMTRLIDGYFSDEPRRFFSEECVQTANSNPLMRSSH